MVKARGAHARPQQARVWKGGFGGDENDGHGRSDTYRKECTHNKHETTRAALTPAPFNIARAI